MCICIYIYIYISGAVLRVPQIGTHTNATIVIANEDLIVVCDKLQAEPSLWRMSLP